VVLPLTFRTKDGPKVANACVDTGSDVNVISVELAKDLGYEFFDDCPLDTQFTLANSKIVCPVGQIDATIWFGRRPNLELAPTSCTFYVLPKTATPVLVGMPFLNPTEIMTKHRDKLMTLRRPHRQASSVCSIGKPKLHMACELNNVLTVAVPDSGSEVDLVSPQFALARGFEVHSRIEKIELADGSIVTSEGYIRATLSIPTHFNEDYLPVNKAAIKVDFLVLDDLSHDVIIGEHCLEELRVFSDNDHILMLATDATGLAAVNTIRVQSVIDDSVTKLREKINMRKRSKPAVGSQ